MKSQKYLFILGILGLVIQGCSNITMDKDNVSTENGRVILTYYTKNTTDDFTAFLQNPRSAIPSRSVSDSDNPVEPTDAEMFAGLWANLSEEEREQILSNPEAAKVEVSESISANEDSTVGRSILDGNSPEISELVERLRFIAQLKTWFQDKEVPIAYAGIENDESGIMTVSANMAVQKKLVEGDWEGVVSILSYLAMNDRFDALKSGWEGITFSSAADTAAQTRSASARGISTATNGAPYSSPIVQNLGLNLQDGDVLVSSAKGVAFLVVGTYNHAGIFSKSIFDRGGKTDYVQSVYSAEPSLTANYESDIRPNRPGYACLEPIRLYTRQTKMAVVRPKNYTTAKGQAAVNNARNIFYDRWTPYWLPINELLYIGNTSHNGTSDTYCSKVPYMAWRNAGVNLDANNFGGNLIAPDELYDSAINRYTRVTVYFLWWSKTWTYQTYAATSNVIWRLSR